MTGSSAGTPGSPPDLSGSKSSKSSSFHSSYQSDHSILSDVDNFEDIGLDDESRSEIDMGPFDPRTKTTNKFYDAAVPADPRSFAIARPRTPMSAAGGDRAQRDLIAGIPRAQGPGLRGQVRGAADGLGLLPTPTRKGGLPSAGAGSPPGLRRNRSTSPRLMRNPSSHLSVTAWKARRSSWQANRERKTAAQLELECDEDDGDDVPDEVLLENVPITPRLLKERTSTPASATTSPERPPKSPKHRVRSLGNGTSPRPAEQGELRSPKPLSGGGGASRGPFPRHENLSKGRAKSWNAALSDLSQEAKALTEALEAHADDEERNPTAGRPTEKPRVKSALAELPPLRRTDLMIDPLPISKEKEAVLSRTRPSWLPPKHPAEEKRHLKEYQAMMASARKAESKRAAQVEARTTCRDDTASSLRRLWEEHVLPNWAEATRQKRTRELWWRGIAPRSRGTVWQKAIGNQLGLSDASYTAALRRAHALERTIQSGSQLSPDEEKKRGWLERIAKDVATTYPELRIFQADGPLHGPLREVLTAYAMYRSDVGHVPGTSTIAALLLLNLPSAAASFGALANLLNRSLSLGFHTADSGAISRTYALISSTLQQKSPRLAQHLSALPAPASHAGARLHLGPAPPGRGHPTAHPIDLSYLHPLFTSLFTSSLSLDHATRLWDVMVFEGDSTLVRSAVALLLHCEARLFGVHTRAEVGRILAGGLQPGTGEEEWMTWVRAAGKG
ncbi:hypothetical protein QTJ16_003001 [Diplocarpon rosae]|uniref:Rab-GAP TBC domain-containing protein n=1 Tax=Diplocarpon rosae TaxID=946125 RepID=A0AAD9T4W3_9HELO|nr:hypothetical protein QTJ16_003001 [Diplocarpon rosae]